jgi:tRNA dimethylallyltransferase
LKEKKVIIILGPTAVGKTALAIRIAKHFQTDIISADSRQCYREMSIGVAKPSISELAEVKHYFINSHSITENVNAAVFEEYALNAADQIFGRNDTAIMVGGTGLYIKAFTEGMDLIPAIPSQVRETIIQQYEQSGIEWLQQQVKQSDPLYYESGEIHNPQRLMRALEVKIATGKSIREFQRKEKIERPFSIYKFGVGLPRQELHDNIHHRVDIMMDQGLLEEVKSLYPYRNINALKTVGYAELFDYIDGKFSLAEAVSEIKKNTRHYAKRQLTWFGKEADVKWISPQDEKEIVNSFKIA